MVAVEYVRTNHLLLLMLMMIVNRLQGMDIGQHLHLGLLRPKTIGKMQFRLSYFFSLPHQFFILVDDVLLVSTISSDLIYHYLDWIALSLRFPGRLRSS